jgi:hypothetical protein
MNMEQVGKFTYFIFLSLIVGAVWIGLAYLGSGCSDYTPGEGPAACQRAN